MKSPAERLLGGHAFGTLTDDERRELYDAALEDQVLFDALAEQEPLRELLADKAVRKQLLDALDSPTLGARLRGFLRRPATWADLTVAASVLVVTLLAAHALSPGRIEAPRAASASPALLKALFELPAEPPTHDQLRVQEGRLVFRVEAEAQVIVVLRTRAGAFAQLFPAPGSSALVAAGVTTTLDRPDTGEGSRVRLAAFSVAVDPLTLDAARLRDIASRVRVLEWNHTSKGDRAP
jgi:hypothetical protein